MAEKKMTPKQLERYKKILLKEREEAQNLIYAINEMQKRGSKDSSGDLSSYTIHQADLGTDTINAETNVYHLNRCMEKVKNINKALHRIHDESYGICEMCGEKISNKRLKVVPFARQCISCKSISEQKKRRNRK
jgi:RNA polymerase-binding protein DksA